MNKFPKIFQLGHKAIESIFEGDGVEITEKIDGSQFRFYKDSNGVVHTYSKGNEIFHPTTDRLFQPGVEYVNSINLPDKKYFYSETLYRPKHNTLEYDKIPKNHIALFGVYDEETQSFEDYYKTGFYADQLGIDVVPLIRVAPTKVRLEDFLELESYLGGVKIEGFVVRNVNRAVNFHGVIFPMMIGKFVSEKYKEKNRSNYKNKGSKNSWINFMETYRAEPRWQKAYQHLRDDGKLLHEPKDIGSLIIEAQRDIEEECKDEILEYLWKIFGKQLLRNSIKGLPEWYKEKLLKGD